MNRRWITLWALMGMILTGPSLTTALIVESPKEGQTIVVGEPFQMRVKPAPGEECKSVDLGNTPFNPLTGRYEATHQLPLQHPLGRRKLIVVGEPAHDDAECLDTRVTVNVVLPPTTTLQEISVDPMVRNLFLEPEIFRTKEIGVAGLYSDGVERTIKGSAFGNTYHSSDEKVVTVDAEGVMHAMGLGKATIKVKNGGLMAESIPVVVRQKIPD